VRGDTGPGNHSSNYTLNPLFGVLTSSAGYSSSNLTSNPAVVSQYCNGSRVPPEATCLSASGQTVPCGWQVPPGISDAVIPNPAFSLTPAATVDEGNNWINISWGPLSMLNPVTSTATTNAVLGNYSLSTSSPDVNAITCNSGSSVAAGCTETIGVSGVTTVLLPKTDFFGNSRPDAGNTTHTDIGAVELQQAVVLPPAPTLTGISPASGVRGTTTAVTLTGTNLTGSTLNVTAPAGLTCTIATPAPTATTVNVSCVSTRATTPGAAATLTVTTAGGTSNPETFTVTGATLAFSAVSPSLVVAPAAAGATHNGFLTLTNNASGATAGPFTFTGATVTKTSGPASGSYSILGGGTCANGTVVNAGSSCTIQVQYAPGATTATGGASANLTVSGTGTALATTADPTSIPAN
jgi:hypothetical protein